VRTPIRIILGAACAAAIAAAAAPASAAPSEVLGRYCNLKGPLLCWYAAGARGTKVVAEKYSAPTTGQLVGISGLYLCSHRATPSDYVQSKGYDGDTANCPFPKPSFDAALAGQQIVQMQDTAGACFAALTVTAVTLQPCGLTHGSAWVQATVAGLPGPAYYDIWATGRAGAPLFLVSTGDGKPVGLRSGLPGDRASWGFKK